MSRTTFPASDFAQLESAAFFRTAVWKRNVYLALAALLQLLVLGVIVCLRVQTEEFAGSTRILGFHVQLGWAGGQPLLWLGVIVAVRIWWSHRAFNQALSGPGMIQLSPRREPVHRRFGDMSGSQLASLVAELAEQMNVGKIRRIIVSDQPDPNAFTAFLVGVGNVVVLNANVLEILPPEGIRSVAAHEVGHIRRKDSLIYLLADVPNSFIYFIGALLLWKIGVGVFWFEGWGTLLARLLLLALVWFAAGWILRRIERLSNLASQQGEYIADAYAAHVCTWESTMNALLLLGQRTEALFTLTQTLLQQPHLEDVEISEDQLVQVFRRFPARELDGQAARQSASRLYIESQLAQLKEDLCVPFSEQQVIELAAQADQQLKRRYWEKVRRQNPKRPHVHDAQQKAEQELESQVEAQLINWRTYDWDQSGHLDAEETASLVEDLRRDPDKMMFRQFLQSDAKWQSHPTMRARLLFLYDAFAAPAPDSSREDR